MIEAREIAEIVRDPRISLDEAIALIDQYARTVASGEVAKNTAKVWDDCLSQFDRVKECAS